MASPPEVEDATEDAHVRLTTLYARILKAIEQNPRVAQERLARRMDVTMRTVQRHIEVLEKDGLITIDRSRKPFTYILVPTASDGVVRLGELLPLIGNDL